MSIRVLAILAFGLTVAACATGPTNTLTQDKRDSLRIDSVEVSFADDVKIYWTDAQLGAPEEPAAQLAFLKQKAVGPIKAALDVGIPPAFRGTYPARLKVRVRSIYIPATAIRVLIGNGGYMITADIDLVDGRTGATLLTASNFLGHAPGVGGIGAIVESAVADDPIIRVSKAFAHMLAGWLKTGLRPALG